ncbi:MAG: VOC family protein [Granulosicoccus sp.]
MPQNLKIDYIELPAADFTAIQDFYSNVFGWTFESWGDQYLAFNDGRLDGGFYKTGPELCSNTITGAALVIFYASDLEAVHEAVVKAGGTILKPTFDFPGGRRFQFADPHGNELAVWTDDKAG